MSTTDRKDTNTSAAPEPAPRSSASRPVGSGPDASKPLAARSDTRTATLRLPFVTASVSVPRRAEVAVQPARNLPVLGDSKRLVFYAGVGALAAFEVVQWPVALLIAAGTAVARQAGPSQQTSQPADHQHGEHTAT